METMSRDLPPWLWLYFPPLAALVVLGANAFDWWEICHIMMRRDPSGGGVFEYGTPLVLLPGVIAGGLSLKGFAHHRRRRLIRIWISLWCLSCLYFAGEELSWGQWLFHWDTPEVFLRLNDQGETNLHNMSNFLDQTPRAFVEAFVFGAGLLLPLWRMIVGQVLDEAKVWAWILPTHVGMVTAVTWSAAQITDWLLEWTDWLGDDLDCRFNDSELREFYIALFLSLYLLSIWRRLGRATAHAE